MVKFLHISLIFLGLIKSIITQIPPTCMKYTQKKIISNTCMQPANSTNTFINTCQDHFYCDYDLSSYTGICKKTNYLTPQFIGGPCNTADDCIKISPKPTCVNKTCTVDNSNCLKDEECSIGKYCKSPDNKCFSQLAPNTTCTRTSECNNMSICRKSNKKCTEISSLDEGEIVDSSENSLCSTAYVFEGKCSSVKLKTPGKCNTTCTYEYKNGTEINSTSSCVCGKNSNGDKYCNFGFDSEERLNTEGYKSYISKLNKDAKCHTNERFIPCISLSFDDANSNVTTHDTFEYQVLLKKYHNFLLINSVKFSEQKPDGVILPVLGAYDNSLITPLEKKKCPWYRCEKSKNTCSESYNPNNWDSSYINITLSNICNSTQICAAPDSKKIYDKEKTTTNCLNTNNEQERFPGESCLVNDDCKNKNCTESKVCQYIAKGEKCSNEDPIEFNKLCGVGYYCNSNNTCVEQIKKNEKCKKTFDCENNLVCFNQTCSKEYGSVKDGEKINTTLISADFGDNYEKLCETFEYDQETSKCYSYRYANDTKMKIDEDGFVECEINKGNECAYRNSLGKDFKRDCECGFNAEGKGYCPVDFNAKTQNIVDDVVEKLRMILNGKCHTLNRYQCDIDSSGYRSYLKSQEDFKKAHLFHKSVSCAKDVLSGKFIEFSLITLLILSFLF